MGHHVANGATFALSYDVVKDFEPIALLSSNPFLILAKKAVPADDLKGLVAWLKANPDKASQAIPTAGSHVAGLLFQKETGTRFAFVPYRGGGPAMQDLVAGQIDLMGCGPAAGAGGRDQGLRRHRQQPLSRGSRNPER